MERDSRINQVPAGAPQVSVVIPFYNEEQNVKAVLWEVAGVLDGLGDPYEIVAVDDGSTDATFEQLLDLRSRLHGLRVLRFRRNAGQTAAVQAGFDASRGRWVVSMDGDGQNDPRGIPPLLERLAAGHDLVCGWRERRKDRLLTRKLPSWVANRLIGWLTGVPIRDNGCSLKAYSGALLRRMRLYSDQHRFIPALASLEGARIAEVSVPHRARMAGQSKYGLSRIYKVLADVITLVALRHAVRRPAAVFLIPGLTAGAAGLVGAVLLGWAATAAGRPLVVACGFGFLLFYLAGHLALLALVAELVRAVPPDPASPERTRPGGGAP